jgi:hypothetical protein
MSTDFKTNEKDFSLDIDSYKTVCLFRYDDISNMEIKYFYFISSVFLISSFLLILISLHEIFKISIKNILNSYKSILLLFYESFLIIYSLNFICKFNKINNKNKMISFDFKLFKNFIYFFSYLFILINILLFYSKWETYVELSNAINTFSLKSFKLIKKITKFSKLK